MNNFQLFINGDWVSTTEHIAVHSPHNGETVGQVGKATVHDVDRAVESAQKAFETWSKSSAYDREKTIRKATAYTRGKASKIGLLMALEQGKPLSQSISEIMASCDTIDYFASEGVRVEGYTNPTEAPNYRSTVIYQPLGVCALITPWNYPVSLLSWKLGPALAAGCSVVVKPTSVTPLSPTAFCHALTEGGLPPGLINVVTGSGATVGEALVKHPLVQKIAMTGSTATGKRLMELSGSSLKRISLELGGQCPAIVCQDADVDLAAKIIAYKGFRNCGQSCSGINRVYAHATVHDAVIEKLQALAAKQTTGDPLQNFDSGPMTTRDGVETSTRHVADALEKGARLVCGGHAPEGEEFARGHYFLPTILDDAKPEMLVMSEETFGPVVPFQKFDTLDEAIALANDTSYGLVAYGFTRDYGTTVRLGEELEVGSVAINHGAVNTNYAPYAGWKDSGYGVELSRRALLEYLKIKHIKVAF